MDRYLRDSPLLRCLAIYAQMPWRFLLTSFLLLLANGSLPVQQYLFGRAIDEIQRGEFVTRLADGGFDFHRAWFWFFLLTGLAALRGVVQYGAGIIALVIGQELLFILREKILVQIQRLDLGYHWRHGVGEIVTRTTRDADKVRDALVNFWRQIFETGLVIASSVAILVWYSPWLGVPTLLLTTAGFLILAAQTERLVALDRAVGLAYDAVNQDLTEGVHGVRVIKAFGLEAVRIQRFERQVARFSEEARTALAYAARRIPLPQLVVATSHVWVLAYGTRLIGEGSLEIGELVASLLAVNVLVLRVEAIGPVMQIFADARSSAGRIWELLDAAPRIESGRRPAPPGPLGLRLEHVRVGAPGGGKDILQDVSLEIAPGEAVALVGATGSGKSLLMSLLPRLTDVDGGRVSIGSDESGWRDLRDIDLSALRKRVHVVPQESFLFSDTLAANLLLSAPEASEEKLRAALHTAAVGEILEQLPEGLDARIGDHGVTLSGGQRQRVCIGRALLAEAAILGLDDATSALDSATEQRLLANIRELREGESRMTLLIVTSKLSTVLLADRIVLLSDGRVAAEGTHESLRATSAVYRDLMGI